MAKKESSTYIEILKDIENNKYSPIYFLMGEEPYFIDIITEKLEETVIKEEEKDFNLTILYGADTDINQILNAARRFPMMSNYQLVIVKEAQLINDIEKLELYTKNLLPSTILVINYKYKKFDLRKKVMKDISEKGILFDSKKIYDDKIPDFILSYVKGKSLQIDAKSAIMLSNFIGNNISRLCSEIDKLAVVLGNNKKITPEIIEKNIGISKDFNNFELLKAIITKDVFKANLICNQFSKDPKNNPIVLSLTVLFSFFANLMLAHYSKDKSEAGLASDLGLRSSYAAKDYIIALKNYKAFKTMQIISLIRSYDAKSKGFKSNNISESELLRELIYKIIH